MFSIFLFSLSFFFHSNMMPLLIFFDILASKYIPKLQENFS